MILYEDFEYDVEIISQEFGVKIPKATIKKWFDGMKTETNPDKYIRVCIEAYKPGKEYKKEKSFRAKQMMELPNKTKFKFNSWIYELVHEHKMDAGNNLQITGTFLYHEGVTADYPKDYNNVILEHQYDEFFSNCRVEKMEDGIFKLL
jgi:hypothetical protein